MTEVSVIIVHYNTSDAVLRCIRSVEEQTKDISFEIILVDNDSPDRSIEDVALLFPRVRYIQNKQNEGFGRACNRGASVAAGAFLFFLNPDTVLQNNALLLFCRFWKQYDTTLALSCLGGRMTNEHGMPVHSNGRFPRMRAYLLQKAKSLAGRLRPRKKVRCASSAVKPFEAVPYVTGADLFISKANFEQMQGFDTRFFMYFEETDLQFRLSKAGKQSYLVQGPRIVHAQYKSFRGNTRLQRILYRESMLHYFHKHYSAGQYLLFYLCWNLLDLRTLVQKLSYASKTG